MRIASAIVFSVAFSAGVAALAQSAPATRAGTENATPNEILGEVIVRGRRLTELRFEVQEAREHAYDIFNEINSSDDFDVHCRDERRHHSRATRRVCRAQFESHISADAAKEYMASLHLNCRAPSPDGSIDWQGCMFSGVGQRAADQAKTIEGRAPLMHDRLNDEILRLARQDLRFGQAILDFFEVSQQYEAARQRRED
jgi:hypothetical protein